MGLFSLIGGIIGGGKQKKAAKKAAQLQYDAAMAGIAASDKQFQQTRADFAPFRDAGVSALGGYEDLLGLSGADEQDSAIGALKDSPMFQRLYDTGRESVLANASATGGLRGGDTQGSLYDLGTDTLNGLVRQQLADYFGLVGIGTGATGATAGFGAAATSEQNDLRNQGAGAKAQYQLVKGGINAANWNNAGGFLDDAVSSFIPGGSAFKKLF